MAIKKIVRYHGGEHLITPTLDCIIIFSIKKITIFKYLDPYTNGDMVNFKIVLGVL